MNLWTEFTYEQGLKWAKFVESYWIRFFFKPFKSIMSIFNPN